MVNLTLKLLNNVFSSNAFHEVERIELIRRNPYQLYFRIIQPTQDGIRYITNPAASVICKFASNSYPDAVDDHQHTCAIERAATMAFPNDDRSIWTVPILPTDTLQYSSMTADLTDGPVGPSTPIYHMNVQGTIAIFDTDSRKSFM